MKLKHKRQGLRGFIAVQVQQQIAAMDFSAPKGVTVVRAFGMSDTSDAKTEAWKVVKVSRDFGTNIAAPADLPAGKLLTKPYRRKPEIEITKVKRDFQITRMIMNSRS